MEGFSGLLSPQMMQQIGVSVLSGILAILLMKLGSYLMRKPQFVRFAGLSLIFTVGVVAGFLGAKQYVQISEFLDTADASEVARQTERAELLAEIDHLQAENRELRLAAQSSQSLREDTPSTAQPFFNAEQFVATVSHVRWLDDSRRRVRITIEFGNTTRQELRLAYSTYSGKRYASTDAGDSIGRIVVDGLFGRQGRSTETREQYSAIPAGQKLQTRWDLEVASREPAIQGGVAAISAEILLFSDRGIVAVPVLIEGIPL